MIEQTVTNSDTGTDGAAPSAADTDTISLELSDLLPDSAGNIVIEYDGGNLAVELLTDQAVVERGVAAEAVDASGGDLSGFAYCAFSNGTTVFFPTDISLHIVPSPHGIG
ncbi:MAG TPA: hypothetical protein VHA35_00405 [Dongiaceae bacterium]|nr:hypothetical protein [Dongiaceae bacterium]